MERERIGREFAGSGLSKDFLEYCERNDTEDVRPKLKAEVYFNILNGSREEPSVTVDVKVIREDLGLYAIYFKKPDGR